MAFAEWMSALKRSDAFRDAGNEAFRQNRYVEAIAHFDKAVDEARLWISCRVVGTTTREDALVSSTSGGRDGDEKATAPLEKSLKRGRDRLVAALCNRALARLRSDPPNPKRAEQDCHSALEEDKDCVKALYRRALARRALNRTKQAIGDLDLLLQVCGRFVLLSPLQIPTL